jgi:hypothetical protein
MNRRFDSEVAMMESMSISELRSKYIEVFNEATASRNKPWLVKRIAWRIQAIAEGGLSERARRRAKELADDAELRLVDQVSYDGHLGKLSITYCVSGIGPLERNTINHQETEHAHD